jgi:hypothetical protein
MQLVSVVADVCLQLFETRQDLFVDDDEAEVCMLP